MTTPGKVEFSCPECQARLRAPVEKVGGRIRCAYCRQVIQVPARTTERVKPRPQSTTTRTDAGPHTRSRQASTATELAGHEQSAGDVDPAGKIPRSSRMRTRVRLVDRSGDTSTLTSTGERRVGPMPAPDEFIVVREGPAQPLPPAWGAALRQSLAPRWKLWLPLALVAGVTGARLAGELEPAGALLGTAAVLLLPLLWIGWVQFMFRRPSVVSARVTSAVPLGEWRLASLRWVIAGKSGKDASPATEGKSDSGKNPPPLQRHRHAFGTNARLNYARTDGLLVVALPSPRARWPVAIVPHHLAMQLSEGGSEPAPANASLPATCPKCSGTGRSGLAGWLWRMLGLLAKLLLLVNLGAATFFAFHWLGTGPLPIAMATGTAVGLVLLLRDAWPVIGCDQCRRSGKTRQLCRGTVTGSVVVGALLVWLLMAPFGARIQEAHTRMPPLDGVLHRMADYGVTPAASPATLDPAALARAGVDAAWLLDKRVRLALPDAATLAEQATHHGLHPPAQPIAPLTGYRQSVVVWLTALTELADAPGDAGAQSGFLKAGEQLEQVRSRLDTLRALGRAAPTLWFRQGDEDRNSLGAVLSESERYARAWFEPLRLLLERARVPVPPGPARD